MMRSTIHLPLLALAATGCAFSTRPPADLPSARLADAPVPTAPAAALPERHPVAEPVLAALDPATAPCQDFYRYACGGWLDHTTMPADRSRWGRGFSEIQERNNELLRTLLEQAGRAPSPDAETVKLGRFYSACMDEAAIQGAGARPLASRLARIDGVSDPASLMAATGELQALAIAPLLAIHVDADPKDPGTAIAHFYQGGLGLPDRDYYLRDDEESKALLGHYRAHIARMLELAGIPADDAARDAGEALALETALARISLPRTELRDVDKTYHKLDRNGLQALTPALPWDRFLAAAGHPEVSDINVATPSFFAGLDGLARESSRARLTAYLRWQLVHGAAPLLDRGLVEENFAFFGKRLNGQKELEPRWKRCVAATDTALGEILGRAFVERRFAGASRSIAIDMIRDIEASFSDSLPRLAWMDDRTRSRAIEKMTRIADKIGYPDRWRDYSALELPAGGYFEVATAARRFEADRQMRKVGGPLDKTEWVMTPPTVNAYYNPTSNEMAFPAGILQPPFFDRSFPAPMNYGGIGMVMGHELTHGFDDEGRKFDGQGRLTEWWEKEAVARFEHAAQCVDDLYSGYELQPGLRVNGKLTLGENIADLGGLKQAHAAWRRWAARNGEPAPAVPGLSNDQLFFVGFAQTWCTLSTPESDRVRITVDPHSPSRFRVNGPVSQFAEFARAFQCAPGTPMNPGQRCEVW